MKKILALVVFSVSMLFAGPNLTTEVKALLKIAKANVEGISAEEVKQLIQKDSVILIDVRDPDEWEKGTIEAKHLVKISRGFLEVKYPKLILEQYTKKDPFVVYCALEPRSILAASRLKELGFENVKYLEGGLKNWNSKK